MDLRKQELLKRPVYVYDIPPDILSTLTSRDVVIAATAGSNDTGANSGDVDDSNATANGRTGAQSCSLCGVAVGSVEEHRSHVRSDMHTYNLKLRLRGQKPVTEDEFEKLLGAIEESLSGSDSEDSADNDDDRKDTTLTALLRRQAVIASKEDGDVQIRPAKPQSSGSRPLIWFSTPALPCNTYLGIYRSLFHGPEQDAQDIAAVLRTKQITPVPQSKIAPQATPSSAQGHAPGPHVFLCMIGGGHFAAMIVSLVPKIKSSTGGPMSKEATVLAHKTFHRYTTRRKQGGSQSANDNAKGAAHSAGSTLRRYNEQALTEEVRQLLLEWKAMIDSSELLFIRANGATNRRTLLGPYEGQVLRHGDGRLRTFPFNTRRATQNELMRAFIELTRVKVMDHEPQPSTTVAAPSSTLKTKKPTTSSTTPQLSEDEQTAILHTQQITTLIRRSKLPALLSYLATNSLSADYTFTPHDHHTPTGLHLAVSLSNTIMIEGLLLKAKADPTVLNEEGKSPYEIASSKLVRNIFRLARHELGESVFAWDKAHVGAPLSREHVQAQALEQKQQEEALEVQRRKQEETRLEKEGPQVQPRIIGKRQEAGRAAALGKMGQTAEQTRNAEMRGLTAEQKMRVERERRARAAEARLKALGGAG